MKTTVLILCTAILGVLSKRPKIITLSEKNPKFEEKQNFLTNEFDNFFEIQFLDEKMIDSQKHFYLIFESENTNFSIKILHQQSTEKQISKIFELETVTGNIVFHMSDTLINERMSFVREEGYLRFKVANLQKNDTGSQDYTLKFMVADKLSLTFGKQYTVKLDKTQRKLITVLDYDGSTKSNLKKLRFQVTSVSSKSQYKLTSALIHKNQTFTMNHIFKKTVGGILSLPNLPVCKDSSCQYQINVNYQDVKTINIESFFIEDIEILDINHYDGLYDKTYNEQALTYYKLPFSKEIEGLDISITLIPVNSSVSLYVNPQSKPTQLENYNWKEKGNLAKKITIKWEELLEMQLNQADLFIAVLSERPGEFYLNLDAHETGYKGRLQPGISEAGFVKYEETNNYLYNFEVTEAQDIEFDVKLNIMTGNADLFIQRCQKLNDCSLDPKDPSYQSVENTQNAKEIYQKFNCDISKVNFCQYLITVKGKENHGTHYDISASEINFHRLMMPGKIFTLDLLENEKAFLKFSYPNSSDDRNLHFQIESDYGDFEIYFSRSVEYPTKETNDFVYSNSNQNQGFLEQFKDIDIMESQIGKINGLVGHYFLGISSTSASLIRLKFYEKNKIVVKGKTDQKISIHALTAGRSMRGEIKESEEIIYYTIRVSLDNKNKKEVLVSLTSLKGDFVIFANRNGEFPNKETREFYSQDNHLTLPINQGTQEVQEYIIGVQKTTPIETEGEKYQFTISFSYSMNATRLIPGILSTYFVDKQSLFSIEITDMMDSLLIMKTIVDGYNIDLCASFSGSQDVMESEKCDLEAPGRQISIYQERQQLKERCKTNIPCYLHLKIQNGVKNEKFQLGYIFNDQPFQLNKGELITGPIPLGPKNSLKFIYHPEKNKPCNLFFNSKGRNLQIYSKIIQGSEPMVFPTEQNSDFPNEEHTYVQNFYYSQDKMNNFGSNPELLISVVNPDKNAVATGFDSYQPFLIQMSGDSIEMVRTHSMTQTMIENQWSYFHLYNNGSADELRIYINTSNNTMIEAYVAKGLQQRPPFSDTHLFHQKSRDSMQIVLNQNNFQNQDAKQKLRGNFVVAVKIDRNQDITIFWNNKKDLNYIELTPGEEIKLSVQESKNLYFNLFVKDTDTYQAGDRGKIIFYFRSNLKADIYLTKSDSMELITPSKKNSLWSTNTQEIGGMTALEISPDDTNYCVDCQYIGKIVSKEDGWINIQTEIEHQNEFLELKLSSPIPCYLKPHEYKKFRVWSPSIDLLDVTVSMLSGYVDIYVSDSNDVSDQVHKERHQLRSNLEVHKMFVIAPSFKYKITTPHYFFLYFKNSADINASLIITADKNDIPSPIFPGEKKLARLAPGETTNFYYTPNPKDNLFEVQFELQIVYDQNFQKQALSLMGDYVELYHISESQERYQLKYKEKTISQNKVYINFDITENISGTFNIHIYNPVGSGVQVGIDLLNGGYRILNLNQHSMDLIKPKEKKIYEAHGEIEKYLYFDMKMCTGDVKVRFLQKDSQEIEGDDLKAKTIKDNNSFLHYLKIKKKNIFLEVENESDKNQAQYDLVTYIEKSVSKDPSSEIIQENDGKVLFETDSSNIVFDSLKINSTYDENFIHKITYTVYLSSNFRVMRYTKNCGEFMLNQTFPDQDILVYDLSFDLTLNQISNHFGKLNLHLLNLLPNTKYYGVLVANIEIYPKDIGYLTPMRSNKVFYDEFIFVSAKYNIPFIYLIQFMIAFAFVMILFCIIKGYIFGNINKLNRNQLYQLTHSVDDSAIGYTIMQAMESEMMKELKEEESKEDKEMDIEEKLQHEETFQEIEMTEEKARNQALSDQQLINLNFFLLFSFIFDFL